MEASTAFCPGCGAPSAAGSRYCSLCGRGLQPEREVYGAAPPSLLLALTALAAILAVLLFVFGQWVVAIVALAGCLLLAAAFATTMRGVSHRLRTAGWHARSRAGYLTASLVTWSQAGRRALALHAEERRLQQQRVGAIQTLGEATYRADAHTAAWARELVATLDGRLAELARARSDALAFARRRVGEERLAAQPTQALHVDDT